MYNYCPICREVTYHKHHSYPSSVDFDHGECIECGHVHRVAKKQPRFVRSAGYGFGSVWAGF